MYFWRKKSFVKYITVILLMSIISRLQANQCVKRVYRHIYVGGPPLPSSEILSSHNVGHSAVIGPARCYSLCKKEKKCVGFNVRSRVDDENCQLTNVTESINEKLPKRGEWTLFRDLEIEDAREGIEGEINEKSEIFSATTKPSNNLPVIASVVPSLLLTRSTKESSTKKCPKFSKGPNLTGAVETSTEKSSSKTSIRPILTRVVESSIEINPTKISEGPSLTRNMERSIKTSLIRIGERSSVIRAMKSSIKESPAKTSSGTVLTGALENFIEKSPTKSISVLAKRAAESSSEKSQTTTSARPGMTSVLESSADQSRTRTSTGLGQTSVVENSIKTSSKTTRTEPRVTRAEGSSIENSLSTKPSTALSMISVEQSPTKNSAAQTATTVGSSIQQSVTKSNTASSMRNLNSTMEQSSTRFSISQDDVQNSLTPMSSTTLTVERTIEKSLTKSTMGLNSTEALESSVEKSPTNFRTALPSVNKWPLTKGSTSQSENTMSYTKSFTLTTAMPSAVEVQLFSEGKTSLIQSTPLLMTAVPSVKEDQDLNTTSPLPSTGTVDDTRAEKSSFAMNLTKPPAALASGNHSLLEDFGSQPGVEKTTSDPANFTLITPMSTIVDKQEPVEGKPSSIQLTATVMFSLPENRKKSKAEKPSGASFLLTVCFITCIIMTENQQIQ